MVCSADIGMEPPPFLREKFPPRPKLRQSTNALNEGYKTVYQLEISEMPARMRYGGNNLRTNFTNYELRLLFKLIQKCMHACRQIP
jgi:hypothetical protein